MLINKYDFSFVGGDMRQVYMVNELLAIGYSVTSYGLENPILDNRCIAASSLKEAVISGKTIITPIPISKDGIHIQSSSSMDIKLDEFLNLLTLSHQVFGGCFLPSMTSYLMEKGISYEDFMEVEEIILYNSIATAEGTIAKAIISSTINLHDSHALILGFGRCARTLAHKLRSLCKEVDISARSRVQSAAAYTSSFGTIPFDKLEENISKYDFIFNTIPSLVMTKEILDRTKEQVVIIDIASAPGGVDFSYAKEIGRYAELYLGIPGKISPKSSATFLNHYLLEQIRKK